MFPHYQLAPTLSADRQTRLRNAATRRRLGRRNGDAPADSPSASVLTVIRADGVDRVLRQQRAHCAA
jgi:hypothetical protein